MSVFPVIFEPILKPKLWGGRRLETLLGKRPSPGSPVGESWELADIEDNQSRVAAGPAKGKTLGQLGAEWGTSLTGRAPLVDGRFPLLIKFLDAAETLSVQVHPTEEVARRLGGAVRVKHEAWYVIDAAPDALIYRGFRPGVGEAELRRAIDDGRIESVLNRIPARTGHCFYLPSGTIHALGAGVLVAEVQTPSDVTYRLYDWDRVDPGTGQPRELHVEQALECVRYQPVPPQAEKPKHLGSVWTSVTSLVRNDAFVIERVRMAEGVEQPIPHSEMVIWMVIEGRGQVYCKDLDRPLDFARGDTVLFPSAMREGRVRADDNCLWLEITVPIASSLADFDRPDPRALRQATTDPGRYVPLDVRGRSTLPGQ